MKAIFRPIDGRVAIKPTAERLGELVAIPRVRRVLDAFLEDVPKRYEETESGQAAIERCVRRPELSAYLLMLVDAPGPNDIVSHPYDQVAHDIGVDASKFPTHRTERLVGMATATGGQALSGVGLLWDPRTWRDGKNWTNLAMWHDPLLMGSSGLDFAATLVDQSPDDSFVTVEKFKNVEGERVLDPATEIKLTGQFVKINARPAGDRQSIADRITVPGGRVSTYVRKTSKAVR